MDTNYILAPNGELYHWGIKGMKWGVRRYQNKDGSLTPAGRKRYAEEEAALKDREKTIRNREREAARKSKLAAKKAELDAREDALNGIKKPTKSDGNSSKPKTIKDMTDDELRDYTNRMRLEKDFYTARADLLKTNPPQVSKGKRFMNSFMNDVLAPTAVSVGKSWMEKTLRKQLGLEDLKGLEDQVKKLKAKKEIAEYKRDIEKITSGKSDKKDPDWEKENKRMQYEDNLAKRETNKLNREIELMKARKAHSEQTAIYDAWLEEERIRREREEDDD